MGKFDRTGDKAPRATQKKSGGGTVLGVFIGLVIGISIAFGVVWYLNKSPLPFQNKYEGAPKAETGKAAAGGNAATQQPPAALPGKPGDKPTDRRFEFYGLLEGKQPAISDENFPDGWVNFYRREDYCATAYFYLDKPSNSLPKLAPLEVRVAGLK